MPLPLLPPPPSRSDEGRGSLLCGQPGGPLGRPARAQGILPPPFSSLPLFSRSDEGKIRRRKEKEQEGGREDIILHKANKLHMFCRRRWSARAVAALGPGTGVSCSYASCCTYCRFPPAALAFSIPQEGALGLRSLSVSGSQSVASVALPRRLRMCLGVRSPSVSDSQSAAGAAHP